MYILDFSNGMIMTPIIPEYGLLTSITCYSNDGKQYYTNLRNINENTLYITIYETTEEPKQTESAYYYSKNKEKIERVAKKYGAENREPLGWLTLRDLVNAGIVNVNLAELIIAEAIKDIRVQDKQKHEKLNIIKKGMEDEIKDNTDNNDSFDDISDECNGNCENCGNYKDEYDEYDECDGNCDDCDDCDDCDSYDDCYDYGCYCDKESKNDDCDFKHSEQESKSTLKEKLNKIAQKSESKEIQKAFSKVIKQIEEILTKKATCGFWEAIITLTKIPLKQELAPNTEIILIEENVNLDTLTDMLWGYYISEGIGCTTAYINTDLIPRHRLNLHW